MIPCYICYAPTDPEFICDRCDNHYCEDCSYSFTLHYQYEGGLCYWYSDQSRKKPLIKETVRENKIKWIQSSIYHQ